MASSSSEDSESETSIHGELPQGSERDLIEYYFNRGLPYKHITLMLEKHHNIAMNERTLKRRLKDYGCSRRHEVDDQLRRRVRDIILLEIRNGPDSLNGYRTMWHILRIRHHINVPRHVVQTILKEVDPQGTENRKRRCLKRRTYVSPGPNFCWHIDGYDKLKPFGFSIHGCVDGFSRRIIWLELMRSNKNPRLVAKHFLKHVKAARGCPTRVYTDPGTENGIIAGMQSYFRAEGSDEYAGSNAHKYVTSTRNQRIECQWSHFRKQRSSWWIDFFHDLNESDLLDLTNEIHREALWFCFADLLQTDLDKVKDYWNSHRIRKSKHAIISGVPDMMYFLPEEFGHSDCLHPVSAEKVTEIENRLENNEDETDPIYEEYFHYVMENNNLHHPSSIQEAGVLFEQLTQFACPS
jgi:hypothetical protein